MNKKYTVVKFPPKACLMCCSDSQQEFGYLSMHIAHVSEMLTELLDLSGLSATKAMQLSG